MDVSGFIFARWWPVGGIWRPGWQVPRRGSRTKGGPKNSTTCSKSLPRGGRPRSTCDRSSQQPEKGVKPLLHSGGMQGVFQQHFQTPKLQILSVVVTPMREQYNGGCVPKYSAGLKQPQTHLAGSFQAKGPAVPSFSSPSRPGLACPPSPLAPFPRRCDAATASRCRPRR